MKKIFAILAISLLSLTSFAGVGSWQLTSEEHYVASDNEAFMGLQAQFPQHFGDVDGTSVISATLDLYNYEFVGPTVCPANDPRLYRQVVSKSVCIAGQMNCMGMGTMVPYPVDPCL